METGTRTARPCILVVDDSELALELSREALEAEDYAVLVARDPGELTQQLAAGRVIDLVILDVQMPGALGDTLVHGLKSKIGARVPILLCSGHDEAALAERARIAAIDGYISKQAGIDAMVATVRRVLARAPMAAAQRS